MADLHPLIIHFPIALLIFHIFLEIFSLFSGDIKLKRYSFFILLIGIIGGIAAVLTGNLSAQILNEGSVITQLHLVEIEKHETYATITIWYFIVLLIYKFYLTFKLKKKSPLQYIFVIFATIGLYLVYTTAKLGGNLVYKYGIGTDLLR